MGTNRAQVLIRGHTNEPESRPMAPGLTFFCVHSAQGPYGRDDPADGHVYLAWDPPAAPTLVKRLTLRVR